MRWISTKDEGRKMMRAVSAPFPYFCPTLFCQFAARSMLAMGVLLELLAGASGAADAKGPNIIFILADDLGYGDVGCYGQKRIKTPHIDRLASEGMRFTDFYAGCTVCA